MSIFTSIRKSIYFKRNLSQRGGRFLTVYFDGRRVNGKVVKAGFFKSRVLLANGAYTVSVRNSDIMAVSADHTVLSA